MAQLNANVTRILTKVKNQPAYNNAFPRTCSMDKLLFVSDRPYDGQPHLCSARSTQPATVSGQEPSTWRAAP